MNCMVDRLLFPPISIRPSSSMPSSASPIIARVCRYQVKTRSTPSMVDVGGDSFLCQLAATVCCTAAPGAIHSDRPTCLCPGQRLLTSTTSMIFALNNRSRLLESSAVTRGTSKMPQKDLQKSGSAQAIRVSLSSENRNIPPIARRATPQYKMAVSQRPRKPRRTWASRNFNFPHPRL